MDCNTKRKAVEIEHEYFSLSESNCDENQYQEMEQIPKKKIRTNPGFPVVNAKLNSGAPLSRKLKSTCVIKNYNLDLKH